MRIPSGEHMLAADLVEPETERSGYGVLFVHGYASSRRSYIPRATELARRTGHTCLAFDLRGHGESPGELPAMTRGQHVQDVVAAYDALAAAGVERIGVCAASYGAYLSCLLLAERAVERLLVRAPALYVDAEGPDPTGSRQHLRELIDANPALRALRAFDGRTLVLECERDEVISQESIRGYLHAARHGTHHILEGATHALSHEPWNVAFVDEIVDWFG
ncbi:alpha/beta hydrolase [Haloechinothrix alba]|nr:alpha/beta fold hydrolase [Haloechinothrix alba]